MRFLLNRVKNLINYKSSIHDNRFDYIHYRITDYDKKSKSYILQCLNTRTALPASITEIIFDKTILSGLYPEQACYIGIEYTKYLETHSEALQKKLKPQSEKYLTCRYGKYRICYEDRIKNICYICNETKEEFLFSPKDIALNPEIIKEFDALQAYYIGFLAGLKMKNSTNPMNNVMPFNHKPYLRLVK